MTAIEKSFRYNRRVGSYLTVLATNRVTALENRA